ncbi:hypothetical protein B0H11DRAFT_2261642 [Mycena galericulata]|nr:hypothetical protein B0H11DRAFT_2261642 [Mycena galericulata]
MATRHLHELWFKHQFGLLLLLGHARLGIDFVRIRERTIDEKNKDGTLSGRKASLYVFRMNQRPVLVRRQQLYQIPACLPILVGQIHSIDLKFEKHDADGIQPAALLTATFCLRCPIGASPSVVELFGLQVATLQRVADHHGGASRDSWLSIDTDNHEIKVRTYYSEGIRVAVPGIAVEVKVGMMMLEHDDETKEFFLVSERLWVVATSQDWFFI